MRTWGGRRPPAPLVGRSNGAATVEVAPRSNTDSLEEPGIPLRGPDPKELRAQVQTDLHAPIAARVRDGRMDKRDVVHLDNRILFGL